MRKYQSRSCSWQKIWWLVQQGYFFWKPGCLSLCLTTEKQDTCLLCSLCLWIRTRQGLQYLLLCDQCVIIVFLHENLNTVLIPSYWCHSINSQGWSSAVDNAWTNSPLFILVDLDVTKKLRVVTNILSCVTCWFGFNLFLCSVPKFLYLLLMKKQCRSKFLGLRNGLSSKETILLQLNSYW